VNIKIPKKTANEDNQKTIKYCMRKPSKLEQASAVIVSITVSFKYFILYLSNILSQN
jgi:hypothetical protein